MGGAGSCRSAARRRACSTRASASTSCSIPDSFIESGLFGTSASVPRTATGRRPTARSRASAGSTAASRGRRQRLHRDGRVDRRHQRQQDRPHEARRDRARHAARLPRRIVRRAHARPHGLARHGRAARQRSARSTARMRETPWASATLGLSYGSSTWYACSPTSA